jgi:hypothetical protein
MKKSIALLTLMVVVLIASCSKKSTSVKSVAEKPMPTVYTAHVLPLLQMNCTPCHFPSKGGFKANFENYESALKFGPDMLVRIQLNPGKRGFMPFKGTNKLAAEDIAVIKKWVDEGMPEK